MSSQHGVVEEPRFEGTVAAAYPLALLEAVRSHDHPGEVLEDEDLSVSLPRRLGLTGVIETQIARYEAARRAGRDVSLNEVMGLVKLVLRRPDADTILREAGQRIARWRFRNRPGLWVKVLHRGPARLALRSARRTAERTLRDLRAGSTVRTARPFAVHVTDCTTAGLLESASACTLFTGMLEELLLLYTGGQHGVMHDCVSRGARECSWTIA